MNPKPWPKRHDARPASWGKAGMTLVEVLVGSAILVALIGLVAGIVLAAFSGYTRTAAMDQSRQLRDMVYSFCERRMMNATRLGVDVDKAAFEQDNPDSARIETIAVEEGRLCYGADNEAPEDLYGDGPYNGMTVKVYAALPTPYLVRLRVEVYDREGKALTHKESAFRLETLARVKRDVMGEDLETEKENPVIYVVN